MAYNLVHKISWQIKKMNEKLLIWLQPSSYRFFQAFNLLFIANSIVVVVVVVVVSSRGK